MPSAKKQRSPNRDERRVNKPAAALFFGGMVALGAVILLATVTGKNQSPKPTSTATNISALATNAEGTNSATAKEPDEIVAEYIADANRDLAAGRPAQAVEKLKKAVAVAPEDEDAHYNLGIALAAAGQTGEARREYEKALEIFPDYGEAHNNLGNLLMNQNEFAEAVTHFQNALAIAPENPIAENNLGTALARQGKVAEALPHFSEAIRLKSDYLEARLNLANGYMTLSRLDEAAQELNTVLRLNPAFEPAQKALARLRARQRGQ